MSSQAATATQPNLDRIQQVGLGAFGVGLLLCVFGMMSNPEQVMRSYLTGYLLTVGLPLGSLALLMVHHLVGGQWGMVMRRTLEASTRTLPLAAVMLVPVLLSMPVLYSWARPDVVAADRILQQKAFYLNVPFFIGRAVFYFAVWGIFVYVLNRLTAKQDAGDADAKRRLNNISGPGVVVFALTVTFAVLDWAMSLDPHWHSTIFGVIFMVGQVLSTLSVVTLCLWMLMEHAPMKGLVRPNHFHDIGNLMLAFTMLWAYTSFSQFLIIWSGNLPHEIPWFIHRLHGGWGVIAIGLIVFHWAVPFLLLLMRFNKRKAGMLSKIAILILIIRVIDLTWIVQPNFSPDRFSLHYLDLAAPMGLFGLWLAFFARQLKARPLEPTEIERLAASAGHH
jgi:hypothetical protein